MSILLGLCSFILSLLFQAQHIPAGDSGDLVTAAATFGVPHPPGYPLYTFIGWILSHIPASTVVWRIGLLSSLSHALVIVFVYEIVFLLTHKRSAAIFSSLFILGNYVFFLYGVTPEVFALLDVFVVLLVWLAIRWYQTKSVRIFYGLCFTAGLSLTHHQVILCFFPALAYLFWRTKAQIVKNVSILRAVGAFTAGFIPYLYVPIAASGFSIINWNHATTIQNFIRLITRVDYGTFQSGTVIGALPVQRLLQIQAYAQYIVLDFTWVGIVCMVCGCMYLWQKNRTFFWFFLIALLCFGPLFLFYASFPLTSRFTLGTYERFLLPSFVIISILIGIGFSYITDCVKKITSVYVYIGILSLCFFYVVYLGGITVWKFAGYASDGTAENLATDVLSSLPERSVLLLDRDSMLFTAQYMRYVGGVRPDVAVIHGNRIGNADYQRTLLHFYPALGIDSVRDTTTFGQFMVTVAKEGRLFSYTKYPVPDGWYWVPFGLVYKLMNADQLSDLSGIIDENSKIWDSFHDPTRGILSHYDHLMLSDVSDIYTSARIEFGKLVYRTGDYGKARSELMKAVAYGGDTDISEGYIYLGLSESQLKQCSAAFSYFDQAQKSALMPNNDITYDRGLTYRDCVGDAARAQEFFDAYAKENGTAQTPLKQL